MRLLKRNASYFDYLPYEGDGDDLNDNELHTGEYTPAYGDPIRKIGNISTPSGYAAQAFYGQDIRYTHVLVMDHPDEDIAETGLVRWKDELYSVVAVRPSINALSAALRKQTVNHAEGGAG